MFVFGQKSKDRLKGVHPDLVKVVERALQLSKVDFSVLEGVRTLETQRAYVARGASQTLKSKHIKQSDGFGHAVDLVPHPVSWDLEKYYPIAEAMKQAAKELKVNVRWGGSWVNLKDLATSTKESVLSYSKAKQAAKQRAFIDAPHFEIQ